MLQREWLQAVSHPDLTEAFALNQRKLRNVFNAYNGYTIFCYRRKRRSRITQVYPSYWIVSLIFCNDSLCFYLQRAVPCDDKALFAAQRNGNPLSALGANQ